MAEDRTKISNGPNARPVNENIAGTAKGVPDEAMAPGEHLPESPSDDQVKRAKETLGVECEEVDTLPLAGE